MACDGGWMQGAMEHWKSHPAFLESEYPYKGVEGTCKENGATASPIKKIQGWEFLEYDSNGENIMSNVQDGTISIAIDASSIGFQFYTKGVLSSCKNNGLNHGVTVVGYGAEAGKEFFLVKNSWGSRWGAGGYVKLGVNNQCGANEEPLIIYL